MARLKVAILGSCVTRDVFRISPQGVEIVEYFARTCIPSLVSEPLAVDDSELSLDSPFQKRMVIRDLKKAFWSDIKNIDYDVLLLDLIDERFDMARIGNSTINLTGELDRSGYLNDKEYFRISRSTYASSLWNNECASFVCRLREELDTRKLMIIQPRFARFFINKSGIVVKFDERSLRTTYMWNTMIGGYYEELHRLLPDVPVICSDLNVANENHVWGLAPIHYIDKWYLNIKEKIVKQAMVI